MTALALGLAACLLLALNAFFVLAEFAIVRVRPSRVDELVALGRPRARALGSIQTRLDEHLGVCQVGITLASVALGMVGDGLAGLITGSAPSLARSVAAIGVSYVVIAGAHIVLGELVPKSVAIRVADRAALWATVPLSVFRLIFFPALFVLNRLANALVRLLGLPAPTGAEQHSETELRIILEHFQGRGMLSFRRLLYLENVFDLGSLVVRDAMRPRAQVRCLDARAAWADNLQLARASHFTRYPLVDGDPGRPVGFVHLKDVVIRGEEGAPDLRALVRPLLQTSETTPLEALLGEMQRRRVHAAMVLDSARQWTGFVTLEDIVEELVGTIRDEFEDEEPVRLADALTRDRIHLGIEADSPVAAVRTAVERMSAADLPLPPAAIIAAVAERERTAATYLGHGVGLPHARVPGLARPFLMIVRSEQGIACRGTTERAHLLFVLLTPAGQPRVHQRLQSLIATLLHESGYVRDRLATATTADEVLDAIRAGEQASLD
jgi:CBS domain containing-hemolysin-like protein